MLHCCFIACRCCDGRRMHGIVLNGLQPTIDTDHLCYGISSLGSSDYILITDYYKVHIKGYSMFTADFLLLHLPFFFKILLNLKI